MSARFLPYALALCWGPAIAQVDCWERTNTIAINQCFSEQVNIARSQANRYWQVVQQEVALQRGAAAAKELERTHSLNRAAADRYCSSVGERYEGGTIRPAMEMHCLLRFERESTHRLWLDFLREGNTQPPLPEPVLR